MNLYLLYTESKNLSALHKFVGEHFPGYHLTANGTGAWKGQLEQSVILHIVAPNDAVTQAKVRFIAEGIRHINDQESVMVLTLPAEVDFI